MKLNYMDERKLDRHLEKLRDKLGIIYFSSVTSKSRFNYLDQLVTYKVIISKRYGINVFLIFEEDVEKFYQNSDDICDVYSNFNKEARQELNRHKYGNFDFNLHCYFPNIDRGFFDENIFSNSDEDEILDAFLKEVPSASSKMKNHHDFRKIFLNIQTSKINNNKLHDKEALIRIKGIFTHETCQDLSSRTKLSLEKESNKVLDHMFERFELDETQVKMVNQFNSENRLILAEAGTGKSVILFLKAQRIAALNPNSRVLVLAFNRYLVEEFEQKRNYENIKNSHIDIYTIDKFLNILTNDYLQNVEYEQFDKDKKCEDLLVNVENIRKYDAIYIDEIQQFEPLWIRLCYKLLKSTEEGKFSFVLSGDINQTTQNGKKNSWRVAGLPSFAGRRTTLSKKYRSTDEINQFVDKFVKNVYSFANRNELPIINELESNSLYEVEFNNNDELKNISLDAKKDIQFFRTSKEITTRVSDIANYVSSLRDEIDLRDTVIMFPYRKVYTDEYIELLKEELEMRDVSVISHTSEDYLRYNDLKKSLALVSIKRCIGLDFKNVILIGLDTYGYDRKNNKKMYLEKNIDKFSIPMFNQELSVLYVALTRAKKRMYIEKSDALKMNQIIPSLIFGDSHE